jgi:hypothetical protein
MDLNQLEGLLNSVITDRHSTENCRRHFETMLADLEEKGPIYTVNAFKSVKNRIRTGIRAVIDPKNQRAEDYNRKLNELQHRVNGVSKTEIYSVITNARTHLRNSIPEFRITDRAYIIVTDLLPAISENELDDILEAILINDIPAIFRFTKFLDLAQQFKFFRELADLLPDSEIYTQRCITIAFDTGNKRYIDETIARIESSPAITADQANTYSYIARSLHDKKLMEKALKYLFPYLETPCCLTNFAITTRKLGDRQAIKTSIARLRTKLTNPRNLTLYAGMTRTLKDENLMAEALGLLGSHLDDPACLTSYAALAKDLHDVGAMQKALPLLERHLGDRKCLSIYATVARELDDQPRIKKSMDAMRLIMDSDKVCAVNYALSAHCTGDAESVTAAMISLKKILDEDSRNTGLYISLAER